MSQRDLSALERKLGHKFSDHRLLERALTHSSLSGPQNTVRDLERLEFLGDRVLGLLTAEELWRRYPDYSEGNMAPRLNALVRKETCAKAAQYFDLDELVLLSPFEEQAGGRKKKAILGDVMEALLGALFIDGGLDASRKAFDQFWSPRLEDLSKTHRDPKTALQEWSQQKGYGLPRYEVKRADGPAHEPDFDVEVTVGRKKPAQGSGQSKRSAQMQAARAFLIREGVWTDND